MRLLEIVEEVLTGANYSVLPAPQNSDRLEFEDENVVGLVSINQDAGEILERWVEVQDSFIRSHSLSLQRAAGKAWNVYVVLLTEEECTVEIDRQLNSIEEDLRAARKLARARVRTRGDVERALAPLLPLRYSSSVTSVEPTERLQATPFISDDLARLLIGGRSPKEISRQLLEGE